MASRQRLSIVGLGAQGSAYAQMISDRTVPSVAIGVTTSADQSRRQHPNRRPPKRRSWPRSGPPVPPTSPRSMPCLLPPWPAVPQTNAEPSGRRSTQSR
jgi:hypothetical protein